MLGSGMNLITTIIGFALSILFIVFVCSRLMCGRLRRIEARQMFEIDSRIDLELQEHRINGLEPVFVAAIPTMKFDQEAFSSIEDAQCSICLAEYQEMEVLRVMPKCGHSFHLSCIDIWLRKQTTCPVCRLSVQVSVETKDVRSAILSRNQSPEIASGHASPAAQADGGGSDQTQLDSISMEVSPRVYGEAAARPSS